MTKQEKNRIKREMHEKALRAWSLAYKTCEQISLPYEIEALDQMIAELQNMRQSKVELLKGISK